MIKIIIVVIVIGLNASFAFSHEPKFSDRTDIIHILESYSQRTGVKFVADPRIKARVNMIGLDIDEISQNNLMDILLLHAFTAYEKEGVVYVVPQAVAHYIESEGGEVWIN